MEIIIALLLAFIIFLLMLAISIRWQTVVLVGVLIALVYYLPGCQMTRGVQQYDHSGSLYKFQRGVAANQDYSAWLRGGCK